MKLANKKTTSSSDSQIDYTYKVSLRIKKVGTGGTAASLLCTFQSLNTAII